MKLKYLPLLIMSILAMVSCSDDDDDPVVRPVEMEKHFTGNELELTLSGNKVVGKDVLFTPDVNDPAAATLTFLGERFDVDAMMNGGARDAQQPMGYSTSSVFAGEPEVKLPITMTLAGDLGTFEGKGESKYYTFDYKGSVLSSQLSVELTNVLLKNTKLAGTAWKVEPVQINDWGMVETTPLVTEWESDKKIAIDFGFGEPTEYSMTQLLTMVIGLPIIPVDENKNVSVTEIIGQILNEVKFENDGSLMATYLDMKSKQPKVSPKGIAQYVVVDDTNMKLILNPFAIAADAAANKDAADKEPSQMAEIMRGLTPMILEALDANTKLSEGININYVLEGDKLQATVDETLFLPLLKTFAPMLQNPDLINTIMEKVKQNPDMAAMAPMLESVLKQFPEVINTTTKMNVGLKFVKK